MESSESAHPRLPQLHSLSEGLIYRERNQARVATTSRPLKEAVELRIGDVCMICLNELIFRVGIPLN